MAISGWIALKLGSSSISIIKICKKKNVFKTFFWPRRGVKTEKSCDFCQKTRKTRKTYLLLQKWSYWPQNLKKWSSPINKQCLQIRFLKFCIFPIFFAQNGGNFSKKWDFSPFLGKKHEIPKNWLKNKENAFQEKFLNLIYKIFLESVFLIF